MSPLFFYSEILEYFSAQSQSEKGLADESECTQISNTLLFRREQLKFALHMSNAFCKQGSSDPVINLLDQPETNHIPHTPHVLWLCSSWFNTRLVQTGCDFCSWNSWSVLPSNT